MQGPFFVGDPVNGSVSVSVPDSDRLDRGGASRTITTLVCESSAAESGTDTEADTFTVARGAVPLIAGLR